MGSFRKELRDFVILNRPKIEILKKIQIISNEPPKSRKDKSDLSDFYDETGPDLAYLKFKISQTGFKVFSRKKSLKDEC